MKLLLLYFVFFVGSALIFIQCGLLFPSGDKLSKPPLTGHRRIDNVNFIRSNSAALAMFNSSTLKPGLKQRVITHFFNNPTFPYKMMGYINYRSLLYNPLSLDYYNLMRDYSNKPQKNKE